MRRALLSVGMGLLLSSAAVAQPDDELAHVTSADPSELARVAHRLGDAAVLERLSEERPSDVRLAAIRATPHLAGPEHALAALVGLAGGRDPVLASAAAGALVIIADEASFIDLDRREFDPSSLTAVLEALDALAEDESARADLRAVGAHVAQQLRTSVVPEAAG